MSQYSTEGYKKYTMDEKVAGLVRSATQDGCNILNQDTLKPIFKDVDGEKKLHGTVALKWIKRVVGSLKNKKGVQEKLIMLIYIFYKKGKNLDDYTLWHLIWLKEGLPLFTEKINDLPAPGKVATMDKWEKGEKQKDSDFNDRQW